MQSISTEELAKLYEELCYITKDEFGDLADSLGIVAFVMGLDSEQKERLKSLARTTGNNVIRRVGQKVKFLIGSPISPKIEVNTGKSAKEAFTVLEKEFKT